MSPKRYGCPNKITTFHNNFYFPLVILDVPNEKTASEKKVRYSFVATLLLLLSVSKEDQKDDQDLQVVEDIEHILCECSALSQRRLEELGAYVLLPHQASSEVKLFKVGGLKDDERSFLCV